MANEAYEDWDSVLKIYSKEDREAVMMILARNGYDVGQHKAARPGSGKSVDYYVHARLVDTNVNSSK